MTYLAFHALFIVPPILLLAWLNRGRMHRIHDRAAVFLVLMCIIAFVYTTPWDNYLVRRGVWSYGTDRVIGVIGYVPIEEYLFFLLQPVLTGLWLYRLLPARVQHSNSEGSARWIGAALYGVVAITGVLLLQTRSGTYLGLILAWAAPVLALQWAWAGRAIWSRRRTWALGVAVPTLYLWAADATAIHLGIWSISDTYTLGPALGPLPLEEAVFFLVTNVLVVQGLLLFLYPPHGAEASAPQRVPSHELSAEDAA